MMHQICYGYDEATLVRLKSDYLSLMHPWGQGIGTELLRQMESFAITIGISRIEAKVRATNEQVIALYKKFGYQIEGTRKMAALINGLFEDEFYIAKLILDLC